MIKTKKSQLTSDMLCSPVFARCLQHPRLTAVHDDEAVMVDKVRFLRIFHASATLTVLM